MALSAKRQIRLKKFSTIELAATASVAYYQGAVICFDTSTGLVCQGKASTTLIPIGTCAESVTLGAGGGNVAVLLFREVTAIWMVNGAGGEAVAAANIGGLAYLRDDATVGADDDTNTLSVLGRVWAIDSVKGVLVEPLYTAADATVSGLD
jgi:hypothetical protein